MPGRPRNTVDVVKSAIREAAARDLGPGGIVTLIAEDQTEIGKRIDDENAERLHHEATQAQHSEAVSQGWSCVVVREADQAQLSTIPESLREEIAREVLPTDAPEDWRNYAVHVVAVLRAHERQHIPTDCPPDPKRFVETGATP